MAKNLNYYTLSEELGKMESYDTEKIIDKHMEQFIDTYEKERARHLFNVSIRIMRASNTTELEDIPLKDVMECGRLNGLVAELFDRAQAYSFFDGYSRILQGIRTQRKRRMLC